MRRLPSTAPACSTTFQLSIATRAAASAVQSTSSSRGWAAATSSVYLKGAALLDDVRHRMGGDAFFDALREIVTTYRYGVATTDGVLDIFASNSKRQLRSLFRAYLFPQEVLPPR